MKDFFVTFGQKDRLRKDGWIRLGNCKDRHEAHEYAMTLFRGDFAMMYDLDSLKPQFFPKGELDCYQLRPTPSLGRLQSMFPNAKTLPNNECESCFGTGMIEQIKGRTDIPAAPCRCIF